MDKFVKKILNEIKGAGFEAFLVGGYVRDLLLGRITNDVDICTNALPKDIYQLFNGAVMNNYGGVNVKFGKLNVDITTYRKESNYENRKPILVSYIDNLKDDLIRRDFTINAIVMDSDGKIIDPLDGVLDLNHRLIRMIGDEDKRLKEDPLRILRAIRLATVLDFEIEGNLSESIIQNKELVKTLSMDRIKSEYSKILMSENFAKGLKKSQDFGLNEILGISYDHVVYTSDINGMWAQINFLNMPFTNAEKSNIIKIDEVVKNGKIDSFTLYKNGLYICRIAGTILNISSKLILDLYDNLPIKDRSEIKVDGKKIMEILNIEPSCKISKIIEDIEEKIIQRKLINSEDEIKKYLIENKGK